MKKTAIALDVLDVAMARLRAGETLTAVRKSLGLDEERLRHALKARFSDYTTVMRAHSGHRPPVTISRRTGQPRRKRGYTPHNKPAKDTQQKYYDEYQVKPHRTWADFGAEERAVVLAKAQAVLDGHLRLVMEPTYPGLAGSE